MCDVDCGDERRVFGRAVVQFRERFAAFDDPDYTDEFFADANRTGDAGGKAVFGNGGDAQR